MLQSRTYQTALELGICILEFGIFVGVSLRVGLSLQSFFEEKKGFPFYPSRNAVITKRFYL